MRLKSFTANSMKEAMKMVRDALGEDAIIIATREENGGRTVRVTAAVEKEREYAGPADDLSDDNWLYPDDDDEATVVEEITEVMLRHSVPEDVLDQVVSCASVMGLEDSRIALLGAMETLYSFRPLPLKPSQTPIMLVGPPGAGKTLAAAKLAARGIMNGLDVAVITTDTIRAGGIAQLEAFTRLMKIDLTKAASAKELKDSLAALAGKKHLTIVDTAGTNPFDPERVKDLARLIGAAEDIEPVLTLPAGGDADESGEMARVFATIGARSMLSTRIDIARRMGGLLAAAHQGGLAFADVSDTAKVADGLVPLTAKRLTQLLMPRAEGASISKARKAG